MSNPAPSDVNSLFHGIDSLNYNACHFNGFCYTPLCLSGFQSFAYSPGNRFRKVTLFWHFQISFSQKNFELLRFTNETVKIISFSEIAISAERRFAYEVVFFCFLLHFRIWLFRFMLVINTQIFIIWKVFFFGVGGGCLVHYKTYKLALWNMQQKYSRMIKWKISTTCDLNLKQTKYNILFSIMTRLTDIRQYSSDLSFAR